MSFVQRLVLGLAASAAIGWVAYRRQALARSGVIGAVLVGTTISSFGGWVWGLVLITFFVLSSLLSRYRVLVKESLTEKFAKGGRRDLGQVLANGGVGALVAVGYALTRQPLLWGAFVGAMATVTADTWATELGVLSKRPPRLLTTWRTVEVGTSGGVSLLGSLAMLAGALVIGLAMAVLLFGDGLLGGSGNAVLGSDGVLGGVLLMPSAVLGGLAGALIDSLLGATVQAIYYSATRDKDTEKRIDPDGTANELVRGWLWMNNDAVNLISSLAGALVGALAWSFVQ